MLKYKSIQVLVANYLCNTDLSMYINCICCLLSSFLGGQCSLADIFGVAGRHQPVSELTRHYTSALQ